MYDNHAKLTPEDGSAGVSIKDPFRQSMEVAREMTTFDEREQAYEAKFAHDEALRFKAKARRDRRFGAWVAGQLGLTGAAAEDYAKQVVRADLAHPGDSAIIEAVLADLKEKGVSVSERSLKAKLVDLMEAAVVEIESGK